MGRFYMIKKLIAGIFVITMMLTILTGCGSNKQTDSSNADDIDIPADSVHVENADQATKSSTTLDIKTLPNDVTNMLVLCDAISMVQVDSASNYSDVDPLFMWKCIQVAISNTDWDDKEAREYDSKIEINSDVVEDYGFSLFGKIKSLPAIPEELISYSGDRIINIDISNDFKYRFQSGDRGTSQSKIVSATSYSDASMELKVMLYDTTDSSEIAMFIYTMRSNTRNTSSAARFAYEITGVRAADTETFNLMKGKPHITMISQVYGNKRYAEKYAQYNSVSEIPFFAMYGKYTDGINDLNDRIRNELLSFKYNNGNEGASEVSAEVVAELSSEDDNSDKKVDNILDEDEYVRILSYPVSDSNYLQIVVPYEILPDDDIYGVRSYNYDLNTKKEMVLDDALDISRLAKEDIEENICAYVEDSEEERPDSVIVEAFLIMSDGSVVFYSTVTMDDKKFIASYDAINGAVTIYDEDEDIVPSDLVDRMKPELTHGR